jgi:hypothetical protein
VIWAVAVGPVSASTMHACMLAATEQRRTPRAVLGDSQGTARAAQGPCAGSARLAPPFHLAPYAAAPGTVSSAFSSLQANRAMESTLELVEAPGMETAVHQLSLGRN